MLERYGEGFYVQEQHVGESLFPPPYTNEAVNVDGIQIKGIFLQSGSNEKVSAEAKTVRTRGRFVTSHDTSLGAQMIVRRASDNTFFRLVSEALTVPERSFVNLKVYAAEVMAHE